MGNIRKVQKKLNNLKLDIDKIDYSLNGTRIIIKETHKEQKEKILALESELEKAEWYGEAILELTFTLAEAIEKEREIFEQELEINLRYNK